MQLINVSNKKTVKLFHKVPHLIYKNDPNWACPIKGIVEDIFNPEKNPSFKNGKAFRWVLLDQDGKLTGRIAAFFNMDKVNIYEQPTGGCGFFECIDDQESANILFNAAKEWLKENGMEAIDGPINFGENYLNWGLLAEGYMPQGYGMPYNPPYYVDLFKNYGFEIFFKQFSYHLDYTVPFPERFRKIAEWVAKKPGYTFKHFNFNESEKFINDFCYIYDEAWRFHKHFRPLNPDELRDFIKTSKAIMDPELIWFAYNEGKPIALLVMIPDINQILRKLKGKLNLIGILKFLYYKKRNVITRTRVLIMGVVPKFRRSGIESAIFWHQEQLMKTKKWCKEIELSWAGDFNPKIVALFKSVGGKQVKTHYTMRYLFDRNKPFKRAPVIE